mgnify:FL=1|tara:strand:+ start:21148 stop:22164 length:1017 start_codon:yes stop_codon:yes gene_type:complete
MAYSAPFSDRPLASKAIAYMNQDSNFIADLVVPPTSVNAEESESGSWRGEYVTFDRRELFGDADVTDPDKSFRAAGAQTQTVTSYDTSLSQITFEEHAQKLLVPQTRQSYASVDVRAVKIRRLLQNCLIRREREAASLLFTSTNYDSNLRETLTTQLDDTNGNPVKKFQEWIFAVQKQSGLTPNVAIFGSKVAQAAVNGFGGNMRGGGIQYNQNINLETIANLLGLDKIFVGKAAYNSANAGATISPGYVWTETMISLLYMPPELLGRGRGQVMPVDQVFAPYFAYRFMPRGAGAAGLFVDRWYDEDRHGDWHRVRDLSKATQVSSLTGFIVTDAVNT